MLIGLPIMGEVSDMYGLRPFAGNMIITALTRQGNSALLTGAESRWIEERWKGGVLFLK